MKNKPRIIKFLEPTEIRILINSINRKTLRGLRDVAFMETLFSTGLRVSEALALLRFADFTKSEANKRVATETLELPIIGKMGIQRVIFFSPRALKSIREYLDARTDDSEYLFASDKSGGSLTVRGAQFMVKTRAKESGIKRHITPHMFRHSFATHILRKGANIRVVQELLGHRALSSTMVYTGVTNKDLLETHKKMMV